jgi:hypothetical protein
MRFVFLVLAMLAGTAGAAASAVPDDLHLTGLHPFTLHRGLNTLPHFAPDGRDVAVLKAWYDNGNAWGHDLYIAMTPQPAKYQSPWNVIYIPWQEHNPAPHDTLDAIPHTGEDVISDVRFATAMLDGAPASILIVADRDIPLPHTVQFGVYKLVDASSEGVGTTLLVFRLVKRFSTTAEYCNADLALSDVFGLPAPTGNVEVFKNSECAMK